MHDIPAQHSLIEQLYQRYWLLLFNTISQRIASKEEAEDILVEVFLAAYESPVIATLSEQQQLAWLRRAAHNKSVDRYRRHQRTPTLYLEQCHTQTHEDEQDTPEHLSIQHEELNTLRQTLSELPEQQQELLYLRFADGLRCSEIAVRWRKSEGSVRTLLSRTLNRLRTHYRLGKEAVDSHE
ncbi:RNA polymerase sigma factor [Dictyobacter halimunensis]